MVSILYACSFIPQQHQKGGCLFGDLQVYNYHFQMKKIKYSINKYYIKHFLQWPIYSQPTTGTASLAVLSFPPVFTHVPLRLSCKKSRFVSLYSVHVTGKIQSQVESVFSL